MNEHADRTFDILEKAYKQKMPKAVFQYMLRSFIRAYFGSIKNFFWASTKMQLADYQGRFVDWLPFRLKPKGYQQFLRDSYE